MKHSREILDHLREQGIIDPQESHDPSIALAISEVARARRRISRRYVVSHRGRPDYSIQFLPSPWPFRIEDILATRQLYAGLGAFRVPRLVGHFATPNGYCLVEDYLPSAVPLSQLVTSGEMSAAQGAEVVRGILEAIWATGTEASEEFIRDEEVAYREYLAAFVHSGVLGTALVESVLTLLRTAGANSRMVLSTGDIIDRNILRVGPDWYVIDFEYAHPTLYFFKEGFRTLLNSPWAAELTLRQICSFLPDIPDEVAALVSLAWEEHLYSEVLDAPTRVAAHESLRQRFWNNVEASLASRLDRHVHTLRGELQAREAHIAGLRMSATISTAAQAHMAFDLQARDAEILALRSENENRGAEIARLLAELGACRDALELARAERTSAQTDLETMRSDALALEEVVAASAGRDYERVVELEQRTRELEEKDAQVADKERQLAAVFQSRSWRLTRPLRGLRGQLRPAAIQPPGDELPDAGGRRDVRPALVSADQLRPVSPDEPSDVGSCADSLKFHVDAFRIIHTQFGSQILEIAGWCFATGDADPVRLELRGDGQTLLEITCNLERPDLAVLRENAQGNSSLPFSGFAETVSLADGPYERFELVTATDRVVLATGSTKDLQIEAEQGDEDQGGDSPVNWRRLLSRARSEFRRFEVRSVQGHDGETLGPRRDDAEFDGRPLKVACFIHNLNLEGATKLLIDVVLGLAASGRFTPTVISPFDGPARDWLAGSGVPCRIIRLQGTENILAGWRTIEDFQKSIESVCELLVSERPDAVMAMVLNNFFVIEAAARLSLPSLWLIQESYDRSTMKRCVQPFAVPALERAFELAHGVVFGSNETSELYRRYNSQRNFHVIHNALKPEETAAIVAGPGKEEARRILGIPLDKRVILSVGTVCDRKDQATLARGLGLLAQRRHDFAGYIVGARPGDPYTQSVARLVDRYGATDCVHLVHATPELQTWYRAADVFAFASRNECYPLAILEALTHGLPIVTTKCIGVSEQVRFGENALSFEFGDAAGLAQQLDEMLSDHDRLEQMGSNSRAICAGMQSYAEMIGQYEALLLAAARTSPTNGMGRHG